MKNFLLTVLTLVASSAFAVTDVDRADELAETYIALLEAAQVPSCDQYLTQNSQKTSKGKQDLAGVWGKDIINHMERRLKIERNMHLNIMGDLFPEGELNKQIYILEAILSVMYDDLLIVQRGQLSLEELTKSWNQYAEGRSIRKGVFISYAEAQALVDKLKNEPRLF